MSMEVSAVEVYVTILGVSLLSSSFCIHFPHGSYPALQEGGVVCGLVREVSGLEMLDGRISG